MIRKSTLALATSAIISLQGYALEWDEAFYTGSLGTFYTLQKADQPYPSSFGVDLAGAYHLPLFVEGHSKAVFRGQYGWYQPRPDAEVGQRGSSNHAFSAQMLLMHDARLGNRTFWWGAGLSKQATYVMDHYEWGVDQGEWALEVFEEKWEFSSAVLLEVEIPFSRQLGVSPKTKLNLFNKQPHILSLDLWFRF